MLVWLLLCKLVLASTRVLLNLLLWREVHFIHTLREVVSELQALDLISVMPEEADRDPTVACMFMHRCLELVEGRM